MGNKKSINVPLINIQLQQKHEQQRSFRNEEKITIVWYDNCYTSDLLKDEEHFRKEKLRQVNNYVMFYNNQAELLRYINSIIDKDLFLILPLYNSIKELLHHIHQLQHVHTIFLYGLCTGEVDIRELTQKFSKIVGHYSNLEELINAIEEEIKIYRQQLAMLHLYDENKQATTRVLTEESGSFLFFQLFHYMIMNTKKTDELKANMIGKCRIYYHGNKKNLEEITCFEQTYREQDAIYWYTRETFVYHLLNKALRTEDIEALLAFQFFITDLSLSLKENFHVMKKNETLSSKFTVYRGQELSANEIRHLQDNVGKLVSLNGYVSTSRSREVALMFAKNILMEIEMDMNLKTVVCADIANLSAMRHEEEVLFDIGAVFEVLSFIEERKCPNNVTDDNTILVIKMKATDKGSEIAREYIEYQKQRVNQSEPNLILGCLLLDMGQYHKSKQYFERILEKHPNDEKVACIYSNLGRTYRLNGQYSRSIEYYELAYQMHINSRPQRFLSAARTVEGESLVYIEQQNYTIALEKLMSSLEMYKKYGKEDEEYAGILNNIGSLYCSLDNFDQAKIYFETMKRINDKLLPLDHPNRAKALINMGNIYYKQKDYQKSLDYYQQGLKIKDKVLPPEHQDKISCFNSIGLAYYQLEEYRKAKEYFQKAMIMIKKTLQSSSNHCLLNEIRNHIQLVNEKICETTAENIEMKTTSAIEKSVNQTTRSFKWFERSFKIQSREKVRRN